MKNILLVMLVLFTLLVYGCSSTDYNQDSLHENVPVENNNEFLATVGKVNNLSIVTEEISYYENVSGYYAKPLEEGDYPGLILIHEWWGLNDNIKDMADVLASEGYRVFAVDLYYGVVAQNSSQASQLSSSVNTDQAIMNMESAVNFLREQGATSVGSMGWCFGGQKSAELSVSEVNLDATVIYYGNLPSNQSEVSNIDSPVLGIFGFEDPVVPVQNVEQFEDQLNSLDIDNQIHIYQGAGHAFANPSREGFLVNETRDSWSKTLEFLSNNLN